MYDKLKAKCWFVFKVIVLVSLYFIVLLSILNTITMVLQ